MNAGTYIKDMKGSPSLEIVNLVLQKIARGEKITSLAIGEPMYKTPEKIIQVAYESMKNGDTHYTSSFGTKEVREAIVEKVGIKNKIKASLENAIFITAKQSIYATLMGIAGERSKILVPNPGYFYREPAMIAGFSPIYYGMNEELHPDLADIRSKLDSETAAIIINTPNNPTGKVLGRSELAEIYEMCVKNGTKIISDEAYEDLVYQKEHISIGSMEDSPRVVTTIFSLSKSYSMTGWRAGYTVSEAETVKNIARVLEHTYTCSPPFIQKASAYALKNGDTFVAGFKNDFIKKRDFVSGRIKSIDGLSLTDIEGAFYAFPTYSKKIKSADLSKELLDKHGVAVIPGIAFGPAGEGHLRISFGGALEDIERGLDRLEAYLKG